MNKMQKLFWVLIAFASGVFGAWFFSWMQPDTNSFPVYANNQPASLANLRETMSDAGSFISASEISTPSVVFIKTTSTYQQQPNSFWFWGDFFGNRGPVYNSGSGVIVSEDGVIVTNNHVVDKADEIEVVMNDKRSYIAKVIGTDPSSDLAVLRVTAKGLPYVKFDNSDNLRIGEWVIAVGNPFNLTSTVTAGIVSAKGRNINIVNSQFPIESFIQTDAAINPGNSGGALVNLRGQLVGINTAIYSQTGSYAGYGFAVPANVVSKVVKDIVEFGEVQRPFLNADIQDIDQKLADKLKEENIKGVYVKDVGSGGAAEKAGLKEGDIILKVDGVEVNSKATYEERISYYRPGDKVKITIKRNAEIRDHVVLLTNREGTSDMLRKQSVTSVSLGADFEVLSKVEREKMGVESGVKVSNVRNGLIRNMNLPEGFVITAINKVKLSDAEDAIRILESNKGTVVIEGVHPNGTRAYYSFYVR